MYKLYIILDTDRFSYSYKQSLNTTVELWIPRFKLYRRPLQAEFCQSPNANIRRFTQVVEYPPERSMGSSHLRHDSKGGLLILLPYTCYMMRYMNAMFHDGTHAVSIYIYL